MRAPWRLVVIALAIAPLAVACEAVGPSGGNNNTNHNVNNNNQPDAMVGIDSSNVDAGSCAEATYNAEQEPMAMLILLDRSESMATNNKWAFTVQALLQAIDQDVFDSVHIGLMTIPSGITTGPDCFLNFPVTCQVPFAPQVPLAVAGSDKSTDPTGVRRAMFTQLQNEGPINCGTFPNLSCAGDGTPLFDGVLIALSSLQSFMSGTNMKRVLLVVSDGTISCTSLSNPQRNAFTDANGCDDWEHPQNFIDLFTAANGDATAPVETFIVGVPGSDTYDSNAAQQPPYYMRDALSSMAFAGAPNFVPAGCDAQSPTFTAPGAQPTTACHFDMTQGNFSTQNMATVIGDVRSDTAGCTYQLPDPGGPNVIDLDKVNVTITTDNGTPVNLARRSNQSNPCDTGDGCWDYNADNNVELIGAACDAIRTASSISVRIVVGCDTIVL